MLRCLILPLLLVPVPAWANTPALLPSSVREMLEAAIANGDESEIATIAKVAKQTNPASADQIQQMVNSWKERTKTTHDMIVREARFSELWTGRVEAGGFRSTGSTSEIGLSGNLSLKRTGLQWSHKLSASADYRRANGITSRERYTASYEPRFEFNPRGFSYGLAQFERDTSIGYDERYTASVGIGYKLIVSNPLDLALDIGPSVRHAKYISGERETKFGARASMDIVWRLAPGLTVKQLASGYAERDVYTLNSLTSIETKVTTRWSAALSYNVQYESETLLSARDFDTLSRLTLTYDF